MTKAPDVGSMMNDRLRLLSGNEALMLDQTDGSETLGQATDVFKYIDRNFERWNCNVVGPPTQETPVRVYEMARDSTFQELFGGFGVALDSLAFTQAFADAFNEGRILRLANLWLAACAGALALLGWAGMLNPVLLLAGVFLLGMGFAYSAGGH
jgi:Transmembrane secretion effector